MENVNLTNQPPLPTVEADTSTNETTTTTQTQSPTTETEKRRVSDIRVVDQNSALNVMVGFLNVAQQRGVYSVEESAKIWECMKYFMPAGGSGQPTDANTTGESN